MNLYIKTTVTPGAKKESLEKVSDDRFLVHVKEKTQRNMANIRVRELVAEYFSVSVEAVRIVNGYHHPQKLLNVRTDRV